MTRSIIIPTFRRAELLAATLDSLASQSERDFEVIVVCDGEDTQTRGLSKSYAAKYPLAWIFLAETRALLQLATEALMRPRGKSCSFWTTTRRPPRTGFFSTPNTTMVTTTKPLSFAGKSSKLMPGRPDRTRSVSLEKTAKGFSGGEP